MKMPKVKSFDCVEMKNEIQRGLLDKYKGLTPEQIREEQRSEIQNDPILGPLYRELQVYHPQNKL